MRNLKKWQFENLKGTLATVQYPTEEIQEIHVS